MSKPHRNDAVMGGGQAGDQRATRTRRAQPRGVTELERRRQAEQDLQRLADEMRERARRQRANQDFL